MIYVITLRASFNCQFGGGKGKLISSVISHFVRTNDKSAATHKVELGSISALTGLHWGSATLEVRGTKFTEGKYLNDSVINKLKQGVVS